MSMINEVQFKKNVSFLKQSGKKTDDAIQSCAEFAIFHSIRDGQITPAVELVGALGNMARKSDVITYLCRHGNLLWTKKKGIYHKLKIPQSEAKAAEIADNLPAIWEDVTERAPNVDKDVLLAIKSVINRVIAAKKKGGKIEHEELLDYLRQAPGYAELMAAK